MTPASIQHNIWRAHSMQVIEMIWLFRSGQSQILMNQYLKLISSSTLRNTGLAL